MAILFARSQPLINVEHYKCEETSKRKKSNQISILDGGLDYADDDYGEKPSAWRIEDGVSPEMIYKIWKELNISHYVFDISKSR